MLPRGRPVERLRSRPLPPRRNLPPPPPRVALPRSPASWYASCVGPVSRVILKRGACSHTPPGLKGSDDRLDGRGGRGARLGTRGLPVRLPPLLPAQERLPPHGP